MDSSPIIIFQVTFSLLSLSTTSRAFLIIQNKYLQCSSLTLYVSYHSKLSVFNPYQLYSDLDGVLELVLTVMCTFHCEFWVEVVRHVTSSPPSNWHRPLFYLFSRPRLHSFFRFWLLAFVFLNSSWYMGLVHPPTFLNIYMHVF